MPDDARMPSSVRYPDGQSVPFEPEQITRALFETTERLGSPDPFLARELTEGVLHFLAGESDGPIIARERLIEIVVKVVREFGHPALAREYEQLVSSPKLQFRTAVSTKTDRPAWTFDSLNRDEFEAASAFTLEQLYSRDIAHAHSEGLIALGGLHAPFELSGVLATVPIDRVHDSIAIARRVAGEWIAIDGPEYDLESVVGEPATIVEAYIDALTQAARAFRVGIILNLNCASPPTRHAEGGGPLFGADGGKSDLHRRQEIAGQLAENARDSCFTIWWHRHSMEGANLHDPIRRRLDQHPSRTDIVFDRAAIQLAPGVDRRTPAALLEVGVNLRRLVDILGGPPIASAVFLEKVASLTRFAKTAAHAKQDFLRRHGRPELREGFLLVRARLVLSPRGLEETSTSTERPPNEMARDIIRTMRSAAENDRPRRIPVQIDTGLDRECWEVGAAVDRTWRQRLRSVSPLHSAAGAGCFAISRKGLELNDSSPEQAIEAAAETAICRVRFGP